MAFYKLDENGKPIKGRTKREPAVKLVRGEEMFHYEVYISILQDDRKYKYIRKRFWLPDDIAAMGKERELKHDEPVKSITWQEGYDKWRVAPRKKRLSAGHLGAVHRTMKKWLESFGVNATIEGTSLPIFVEWVTKQAAGTKGRGAQLHHTHLMTIARWCRSRGFVAKVPFEHAPKPEAMLDKRRAATIIEFMEIADLLPPQMYWMWWMLGLTGMRISAACNLLETDIGAAFFTVTTKGDKRIEYPITPEIQFVIDNARAWKKEKRFESPTLFCSHRGRTWKHDAFDEQLRKRAPTHKITPHQLRHMAGTIMAEGNLSPDIIQAGLGHDERSSAEVYIDQTKAMRQTALTAVTNALRNVQNVSKKNTLSPIMAKKEVEPVKAEYSEGESITCPCCSCKILPIKKLKN